MERFVGKGFYKKFTDTFGADVRIKDSNCSDKKDFGSISGDYNGVAFYIAYDEGKLVAFIDSSEKETLKAMIPFLCDMVRGANPNFQYECSLKNTYFNPKEAFALEWSNRPEARACELRMCEKSDWEYHPSVFPFVKVRNVSGYTGEPIYGINPGDIVNPVEVADMASEDDSLLFYFIYGILIDIAYNSYNMSEEALQQRYLALDYAISQTRALGLDVSQPEYGKRITTGESFYAWFEENSRMCRLDSTILYGNKSKPNSGRVKTDLPKAPVTTV